MPCGYYKHKGLGEVARYAGYAKVACTAYVPWGIAMVEFSLALSQLMGLICL